MARPKKEATVTTTAAVETTAKKTAAKKTAKKDAPRVSYWLKVRVTFQTPLLATNPNDADLYGRFIGNNAPDAETLQEEIARTSATEVAERGMTVFARNPETGEPELKSYTWRGFLKDRSSALAKIEGTRTGKIKAFIKEIDKLISVMEEKGQPGGEFIRLHMADDTGIGNNQRPLRAKQQMQEVTALASSEELAPGSWCEFWFHAQRIEGVEMIAEALEYGEEFGTGQWRNSGKGTFTFEVLEKIREVYETKHPDLFDWIDSSKKADAAAGIEVVGENA